MEWKVSGVFASPAGWGDAPATGHRSVNAPGAFGLTASGVCLIPPPNPECVDFVRVAPIPEERPTIAYPQPLFRRSHALELHDVAVTGFSQIKHGRPQPSRQDGLDLLHEPVSKLDFTASA